MIPLTRHIQKAAPGERGATVVSRAADWLAARPVAVIAVLWLAHAGMNLAWRLANVTVVGWDRSAHLLRALDYLRMLQPFGLEGLMNVFTQPAFYPPFYHLSIAAAFALFGPSSDSGAMVNAIYLGVLLLSVYGIGEDLFDRKTGVFAAVLVSFFPIIYNLSRFTYIEFSMTALVALAVCCLLRSRGFTRRGWSWLFGLALGIGLLSKWVFVAFAAPPLLYALFTSDALPDLRTATRSAKPDVKRLVLCVVLAGSLAAVWLRFSGDWPAKDHIGRLLAAVYVLALAPLLYLLGRRSRPAANLLIAGFTAAVIAAGWYLPNLGFLETALFKAYHIGSQTGDAFVFQGGLQLWVLFRGMVKEDLSAPVVLAGVALFVAWVARRRRMLPLSGPAWLLLVWFAAPLAFFASFSNETSWNMRLTVPILLPLGFGLARLAVRSGRAAPLALSVVMVIQWLVLSLDLFAPIPPAVSAAVPLLGRIGWFASGEFAQWPSTGPTDEEYNLAAPVLRAVLGNREPGEKGHVSLGLLVNQPYLNGYRMSFVAEQAYPEVEVVDLYRDRGGIPVYPELFRLDYVLAADSGIRPSDQDEAIRVTTSILTHPTADFGASFSRIHTYHLPNGDRLHLFANRLHRAPRSVPADLMPRNAGQVVNLNFADQLLLASYQVDSSDVAGGKLKIDLIWVGIAPMADDYRITLKLLDGVYYEWARQEGHPGYGSHLTTEWSPGEVVRDRRVIEIPPGTPPGSYQVEIRVYGEHEERELYEATGKEPLLGSIELVRRSDLSADGATVQHTMQANFGDSVRLIGYDLPGEVEPSSDLPLTLYWQGLRAMSEDYTVFVHLVDEGGQLWGQKDNEPANGFYPTSRWAPGEFFRDPYRVPIEQTAPDGAYYLHVGLYRPDTGERLPASGSAAGPDGSVKLGPIVIRRNAS